MAFCVVSFPLIRPTTKTVRGNAKLPQVSRPQCCERNPFQLALLHYERNLEQPSTLRLTEIVNKPLLEGGACVIPPVIDIRS